MEEGERIVFDALNAVRNRDNALRLFSCWYIEQAASCLSLSSDKSGFSYCSQAVTVASRFAFGDADKRELAVAHKEANRFHRNAANYAELTENRIPATPVAENSPAVK